IRSMKSPPACLAIRYAYSAVLKFPTCILPVGLGANLVFTFVIRSSFVSVTIIKAWIIPPHLLSSNTLPHRLPSEDLSDHPMVSRWNTPPPKPSPAQTDPGNLLPDHP